MCVWSVRAVRRRRRVVVGAMLETALVGRLGGGNLASRGFWTCPVRLAHPRNDPRKVLKIQVYSFQRYSSVPSPERSRAVSPRQSGLGRLVVALCATFPLFFTDWPRLPPAGRWVKDSRKNSIDGRRAIDAMAMKKMAAEPSAAAQPTRAGGNRVQGLGIRGLGVACCWCARAASAPILALAWCEYDRG